MYALLFFFLITSYESYLYAKRFEPTPEVVTDGELSHTHYSPYRRRRNFQEPLTPRRVIPQTVAHNPNGAMRNLNRQFFNPSTEAEPPLSAIAVRIQQAIQRGRVTVAPHNIAREATLPLHNPDGSLSPLLEADDVLAQVQTASRTNSNLRPPRLRRHHRMPRRHPAYQDHQTTSTATSNQSDEDQ